jgi:hypothetical protein
MGEKATKVNRIKDEYRRISKHFKRLPKNQREFIEPLLGNMAFMKVTLEDLQDEINENGCVEIYQNGRNQSGQKASGAIQSYNALIKNYNAISERIEKLLPHDTESSKLEKMMDD